MPKILAIESSCDETSAAVIKDNQVLSNIISSQHFHSQYGGVVPELASRAHLQSISYIVKDALQKADCEIKVLDAFAVTSKPGLIGSLIVGSNFAKGLSILYNKPIIPINHIEGHLFSGSLETPDLEFPYITLVVSGGHTSLFYVESFSKYNVFGNTKDDAAGEAFDKVAKLLGLGYPGGPLIDKLAKQGDKTKYNFPRPLINEDSFNFSFSGLKTAVRYFIHKNFPNGIYESEIPDFAASVQEAIVEVLTVKAIRAAEKYNVKSIVIAGGVSANSRLRELLKEKAEKKGIQTVAPKMSYCVDNAAMIGFIAEKKYIESGAESFRDLTFKVSPVM